MRFSVIILALILTVAFVQPPTVLATNYYVDNTASGNSDSNDGLAPTTGGGHGPWSTIGKCNSNPIAAGDTCNVSGGPYNARIDLTVAGSSGSRITYLGVGSPKVRSWTVEATADYTTIQGFEITKSGFSDDGERQIQVYGDYVYIISNNIHDTNDNYQCIRYGDGSSSANNGIIRGNTINHCGSEAANGGQAAVGYGSTDLLIENNTVSYVGDFYGGVGTRVVIRNNTHGPTVGDAAIHHIDGLSCFDGNCNRVLYEGNVNTNNGGTDNHFAIIQNGSGPPGSKNVVLRYNTLIAPVAHVGGIECTNGGDTGIHGCYTYNNTWANTQFGVGEGIFYNVSSTNNYWLNNILYNVNRSDENPFQGAPVTKDYDLWYLGGDPGETNDINADPLFVSLGSNDVHLQSSSPARNAGTYLTTTSGSGSASTSMTVTDASWFQDGWAGTTPDCISVVTVNNIVCISSINYSTNIITLATPTTWANGDHVWLKRKSDGVDVLTGSAPNIGALGTPAASVFRLTTTN